MGEELVVIDASNLLLGRLSSIVAKQLLLGKCVTVVNSEKATISGRRESALEVARRRLQTRTLGAKFKGPMHPRRSEGIVRRVVRGMLPLDKPKGKVAYRRLRVYVDIPEGIDAQRIMTLPEAKAGKGSVFLTINGVAQSIGWGDPTGE